MTTDPLEYHVDEGQDLVATPASVDAGLATDELFPDPTAGMVVHRVLAMAARTFLLNDLGEELRRRASGAPAPSTPSTWRWGPVHCGRSRRPGA